MSIAFHTFFWSFTWPIVCSISLSSAHFESKFHPFHMQYICLLFHLCHLFFLCHLCHLCYLFWSTTTKTLHEWLLMEDKSKVSPFSYKTTSSSLSIGIMSLKSGFLSFSFNWLTDRARGVWFEAIRQKKKYLKIRIHLSLHMSNLIPPAFTHIRY